MVLVGPSGCGKSTTLRMIAGLEEITGGEIWIGGRRVNDVPPRDRDIAMVFQNYALYPHMTVFDNMAFGLKLRGTPKAEIKARVDEAARILDITPLLDRKPKALSGGQRQRVAMGRAIVRNPKVFLFDEPLSNLDAKLRVQMRTEIKKVHQAVRTTTVYVTHDQVEAMTLADRVVVMNGGVIEQVGPPQELYHRPLTRFVAGFIGSPGMNFLPGARRRRRPSTWPTGSACRSRRPRLDRYATHNGREMVLGLRPEHLADARYAEAAGRPGSRPTPRHGGRGGADGHGNPGPLRRGSARPWSRAWRTDTAAEPGQPLPLLADMTTMHLIDRDAEGRMMEDIAGRASGSPAPAPASAAPWRWPSPPRAAAWR